MENWKKALEIASSKDKLVLDADDFLSFETKRDRIRIILNLTEKLSELSVSDFVRFFQDRYERMKRIIESRLEHEFVSLDKLSLEEKWCVVMIRDYMEKERKAVIEDLTGSAEAVLEKAPKELERDDVVAVRCRRLGDLVRIHEVLYPDVPLREPRKGHGKICVIGDLHLDEAPLEKLRKFVEWFRAILGSMAKMTKAHGRSQL